ncbi:MAG: DinB family protein [Saprospiraceae bacterium]|nr:DinB family protein [Saprospiraceae bacterium]MBK8449475.1 DinB family protein [Saprospiraceae bacterium]
MSKQIRNGAKGALLDVYEKAIEELITVVSNIPNSALTVPLDMKTTDVNCKTIQSILSHVISSGYGYAISIQNLKFKNLDRPEKSFHENVSEYIEDLTKVFNFTETVFNEIHDQELEQSDNALKIKTSWGQIYDIEQITEHAIVHILRHKRQIENIKINLLK